MLRWAQVRSLVEGLMQRGRAEGHAVEARDAAPRPQDYGFAGNPGEGQALYLEVNGQTVILRIDRLTKRPALAPLEVAVWHDEGHMVRLKAGRVVEVDCDVFRVNAATGVELNTPTVAMSAAATVGTTLVAQTDVQGGGKSLAGHRHSNVLNGPGQTDTPV